MWYGILWKNESKVIAIPFWNGTKGNKMHFELPSFVPLEKEIIIIIILLVLWYTVQKVIRSEIEKEKWQKLRERAFYNFTENLADPYQDFTNICS